MIARGLATLAVLVALAGCGGGNTECEHRPAPTPFDHATTGTIAGTVSFTGQPPAMAELALGGDATCKSGHTGPVLAGDALVKDGRVQNAFVYLKDGLGDRVFPVPTEPVTLDQRGCLYSPHVAGAQVCQPVTFVNSDALLHNVHGAPEHSRAWNFGMGVQGSKRTVQVGKAEVMIPVRCDVHPWMLAYLGVVDHPYFAVTGPDGRFSLADVPPGDYVVASWHERFGTRETRVTVGPKETKDVAFAYSSQ
jgi:hypothetical protein